jgi:hypothetical protein
MMKKIKRLILHIGTRKTGSTSIQETLGHSRDTLLEHNIYYPAIKPFNHIFSFLPIFMKDPTDALYFKRDLKPSEDGHLKVRGYREAWVKEIESCEQDHFIISAEEFTQPHFAEDAVSRLKSFAEQYFEKTTIIVYVRHYDQLISSQIQQEVMTGYRTVGIKELVQEYLNCPSKISYKESLRKWINVFGRKNLVVRPFDPQVFHRGSLLADFFYSLGFQADDISIPEVMTNISLGKHAVYFLLKYNQAYPLFVNDSLNPERGMAKKRYPGYLYRNIAGERFNLELTYSPEQARKFNEEIDYVNQFFANGYRFIHVTPENTGIKIEEEDNIPVDFFVDLINNYNKQVETLQDRNLSLREQNALLQEQNEYYQRIASVLRIPLLLRLLEKLKLKGFIQRLTKWNDNEKN